MSGSKVLAAVALLAVTVISCSVETEGDRSVVGSVTATTGSSAGGGASWLSAVEVVEFLTSPADEEQMHQRFEETLAACMRGRGFEYTPRPFVEQPPAGVGSVFVPVEQRRGFMEEFGYGRTTLYWERERARLDTVGVVGDPNEARLAAMSEGEREAFEDAMWGERIGEYREYSEGGGGYERNREASCWQEALDATRGFDRESLARRAGRALSDVLERVAADPDVIDADDAWHACMADAGYPIDRIQQGEEFQFPFAGGEELVLRLTDQLLYGAERWVEVEVVMGDGSVYVESFPEFAPEKLVAARAEELAIATADLACDEASRRSETIIAARDRFYEEVVEQYLTDFLEVIDD